MKHSLHLHSLQHMEQRCHMLRAAEAVTCAKETYVYILDTRDE